MPVAQTPVRKVVPVQEQVEEAISIDVLIEYLDKIVR